MLSLALPLSLSIAGAANIYATVAFLGVASRMGWIGPLPGELQGITNLAVIALAGTLAAIEFVATLFPGIASAWETVHAAIRPPAATVLAVGAAWHADPVLIAAAALLGGGLAVGTAKAKLGSRYAVDLSPEPVTNGLFNVAELGAIAAFLLFVWEYPWIALGLAVLLLALIWLAARAVLRRLRRVGARLTGPSIAPRSTGG